MPGGPVRNYFLKTVLTLAAAGWVTGFEDQQCRWKNICLPIDVSFPRALWIGAVEDDAAARVPQRANFTSAGEEIDR